MKYVLRTIAFFLTSDTLFTLAGISFGLGSATLMSGNPAGFVGLFLGAALFTFADNRKKHFIASMLAHAIPKLHDQIHKQVLKAAKEGRLDEEYEVMAKIEVRPE